MTESLEILAVLLVLSLIPVTWLALRAFRKYRGTRLITCPENGCAAAVEIDRKHAAATTFKGETELRLESCSRWPEKQGCGQECLSQIEASPDGCLVRNMLIEWYRDSICVFCRHEIPEIRWSDHKPALLAPDGKTVEWQDVKAEDLPRVLATHKRVCWNCHIAQSFRAQFPGLAVERPAARRAS